MPLDLPPMPPRIAVLPRDHRGYPIPWFCERQDPHADLGRAAAGKRDLAYRQKRCWICGQHLGVFLCFPVDAGQTLTRLSQLPPSHLACAAFAAVACPRIVSPPPAPGDVPPVMALWSTKSCLHRTKGQNVWFEMGEPGAINWYCRGRAATKVEATESLAAAMRVLSAAAALEGFDSEVELLTACQAVLPMLPRPEPVAVA